ERRQVLDEHVRPRYRFVNTFGVAGGFSTSVGDLWVRCVLPGPSCLRPSARNRERFAFVPNHTRDQATIVTLRSASTLFQERHMRWSKPLDEYFDCATATQSRNHVFGITMRAELQHHRRRTARCTLTDSGDVLLETSAADPTGMHARKAHHHRAK